MGLPIQNKEVEQKQEQEQTIQRYVIDSLFIFLVK